MSMYGMPSIGVFPPQGGGGGVPAVPFEQPKPVIRYGEQSLWSSQLFLGGAAVAGTSPRVFSVQQGLPGQGYTNGLSIAETNLREGGRIPAGQAYDVFGIALQFMHSDTAADGATFNAPCDDNLQIGNLLNFQNNGVLTWDFTQTQVQVAPFTLIGAGGGAFGGIATTQNAVDRGHLNNGAGSIWVYRVYPVALPGTTTFGLLLQIGTRAPVISANTAIAVRVVLVGYYKNVVELG